MSLKLRLEVVEEQVKERSTEPSLCTRNLVLRSWEKKIWMLKHPGGRAAWMHALDFPLGAATACSAALLQTLDCLSNGAVKYDLLFSNRFRCVKNYRCRMGLGDFPAKVASTERATLSATFSEIPEFERKSKAARVITCTKRTYLDTIHSSQKQGSFPNSFWWYLLNNKIL